MMRFLAFLLSSALVAEALYKVTNYYSDVNCETKDVAATTKANQAFQTAMAKDTTGSVIPDRGNAKSGECLPMKVVMPADDTPGNPFPDGATFESSFRFTCESAGSDNHKYEVFRNDAECIEVTTTTEEVLHTCVKEEDTDSLKAAGIEGDIYVKDQCEAEAGPGSTAASAASTFAAFPGVAVVMSFLAIAA